MPSGTAAQKAAYMREYRRQKRLEAKEKALKPKKLPPSARAQALALADWSKDHLKIPPGHPNAGKPMELPPYGVEYLADALDHRESLMCIGRKNAKSAIVAVFLLGRLVGPIAFEGYRGGVVSVTKEKAQELWMQCRDIAEASELPGIEIRQAPRRLLGHFRGMVEFLAADSSAGHASGFDDAICDELGLMQERSRDLVNGMRSSVSSRDGRFMALSIQGDSPFTAEMIARRDLAATAVHMYAADDHCQIDDEAAWAAANPGLEFGIKSLAYMRDEAARCLASPADERSFRAFDLNTPTAPGRELICSVSDWQAIATDTPARREGGVVLGIDLGGSSSMAAAVALWPRTGRVEEWAAFPGEPSLARRGMADGVGNRYCEMADNGELWEFPGERVTPVEPFLRRVADALAGETIMAVGADRFRKQETIQALDNLGLRWRVMWRGTGASSTADGTYDVRAFQRMVLGRFLSARDKLLWKHAILESEIRYDAGGNPALDKRRKQSRIDVLQAGVIAAGLAALFLKQKDDRQLELKIA